MSGVIQGKEYCPSQQLDVVAIKKGAFKSSSLLIW